MSVRASLGAVAVVMVTLFVVGCAQTSSPTSPSSSASSSVSGGTSSVQSISTFASLLAPFPAVPACVSAVSAVITKVEAQSLSGLFVNVPLVGVSSVTVNLLDLRNGLTQDVALGQLPTGTYHQLRVLFADQPVTIEFTNGTLRQVDFDVPSMTKTGLKVNVQPHFVVAKGQTTGLLLDFDLAQSFQSGQNPQTCDDWKAATDLKLLPVIQATNIDTIGVLSGNVTDTRGALANAEVSVFAPGDTTTSLGSTFSDAKGDYALALPAGTYDVYARHDAAASLKLVQQNVVVDASQITTRDVAF